MLSLKFESLDLRLFLLYIMSFDTDRLLFFLTISCCFDWSAASCPLSSQFRGLEGRVILHELSLTIFLALFFTPSLFLSSFSFPSEGGVSV